MLRQSLFWLHLAAGVTAGVIILIMCATGVLLTYERQINEWSISHLRSHPPTPDAIPLPVEDLLLEVSRTHPGMRVTGLTLNARPDAAVTVLAEPTPLYVDAYTGRELGERRGTDIRRFLANMRAWHRWLAMEGEQRTLARAITGWSNLLFLFIVVSGMYLWIPRLLTWQQIRQVVFFKRRYGTGKARDFNWHNVIGIWSAVPLFFVVLGAVPISFPWANDLVYRVVGEEPPARGRPEGPAGRPSGPGGGPAEGGRPAPGAARAEGAPGEGVAAQSGAGQRGEAARAGGRSGGRSEGGAAPLVLGGLNAGFALARADQPEWRTISIRFPRRAEDPLPFAIDGGDGGQPQLRSTLTLTRAGEITARETFADQSTGRQVRSVLRFAHTGEVLGVAGQTVAGLVTAGGVVMVWTGLALALRRLRSWQARRRHLTSDTVPAGVSPERS